MKRGSHRLSAFSLIEVVLAVGIAGGAVLATVGLLSVASDTNKRSRDETFAAQVVANRLERLRSLRALDPMWTNSPPASETRYYDASLADLGTDKSAALTSGAVYEMTIAFQASTAQGAPDLVLSAEVRFPASAPTANQSSAKFTALMNIPK